MNQYVPLEMYQRIIYLLEAKDLIVLNIIYFQFIINLFSIYNKFILL